MGVLSAPDVSAMELMRSFIPDDVIADLQSLRESLNFEGKGIYTHPGTDGACEQRNDTLPDPAMWWEDTKFNWKTEGKDYLATKKVKTEIFSVVPSQQLRCGENYALRWMVNADGEADGVSPNFPTTETEVELFAVLGDRSASVLVDVVGDFLPPLPPKSFIGDGVQSLTKIPLSSEKGGKAGVVKYGSGVFDWYIECEDLWLSAEVRAEDEWIQIPYLVMERVDKKCDTTVTMVDLIEQADQPAKIQNARHINCDDFRRLLSDKKEEWPAECHPEGNHPSLKGSESRTSKSANCFWGRTLGNLYVADNWYVEHKHFNETSGVVQGGRCKPYFETAYKNAEGDVQDAFTDSAYLGEYVLPMTIEGLNMRHQSISLQDLRGVQNVNLNVNGVDAVVNDFGTWEVLLAEQVGISNIQILKKDKVISVVFAATRALAYSLDDWTQDFNIVNEDPFHYWTPFKYTAGQDEVEFPAPVKIDTMGVHKGFLLEEFFVRQPMIAKLYEALKGLETEVEGAVDARVVFGGMSQGAGITQLAAMDVYLTLERMEKAAGGPLFDMNKFPFFIVTTGGPPLGDRPSIDRLESIILGNRRFRYQNTFEGQDMLAINFPKIHIPQLDLGDSITVPATDIDVFGTFSLDGFRECTYVKPPPNATPWNGWYPNGGDTLISDKNAGAFWVSADFITNLFSDCKGGEFIDIASVDNPYSLLAQPHYSGVEMTMNPQFKPFDDGWKSFWPTEAEEGANAFVYGKPYMITGDMEVRDDLGPQKKSADRFKFNGLTHVCTARAYRVSDNGDVTLTDDFADSKTLTGLATNFARAAMCHDFRVYIAGASVLHPFGAATELHKLNPAVALKFSNLEESFSKRDVTYPRLAGFTGPPTIGTTTTTTTTAATNTAVPTSANSALYAVTAAFVLVLV